MLQEQTIFGASVEHLSGSLPKGLRPRTSADGVGAVPPQVGAALLGEHLARSWCKHPAEWNNSGGMGVMFFICSGVVTVESYQRRPPTKGWGDR